MPDKHFEEAQPDARRRAALDRVRAEIVSMRSAGDLQRISALMWRELSALGVPFFQVARPYLQGAPLEIEMPLFVNLSPRIGSR